MPPKQTSYKIPLGSPTDFGALGVEAANARILVGAPILSKAGASVSSLAMQVVSTWTYVEHEWASVLTALLQAEWSVVAEMWISLRTANTREAVFQGAAKLRMKEDLPLLTAIQAVVRPVGERRNKYVHHLWGWSPEFPDRLCLVPPQVSLRSLANRVHQVADDEELYRLLGATNFKAITYAWQSSGVLQGDQIMTVPTFTAYDVALDLAGAHKASNLVHNLSIVAAQGTPEADAARRWLLEELWP